MRRRAVVLALCGLLAGCQFFGQNTIEQTLVVENQVLGTELAAIRATATVEADRINVTLEHAQTAVGRVNVQTQDLQATLIARGTQVIDLGGIVPQAPDSASGAALPPIESGAAPVAPIIITPGAADNPLPTASGLDALIITPVGGEASVVAQDTGGPLTNIVMSRSVGDDDCANAPLTVFPANTSQIYVVARARGIGPGDTVASFWAHDGAPVVDYSWSPTFEIEDACIWFYIDQSDVAFTPGGWSVEMRLNGAAVGNPVAFTISADSGPAPGDAALQGVLGGATPASNTAGG